MATTKKSNVSKTVKEEIVFVKEDDSITELSLDLGREDLNLLVSKLNEVIRRIK